MSRRSPEPRPFRRGHEDDDSPGTGREGPVDLAAVQADDALLDMLGGVERDLTDAALARVLVAWRRDVDAEPIGELVDTDTAVAAISATRTPPAARRPVLAVVSAVVASLVIAFSGLGLVAKSAQPGDRLWPVTQVLYGDYARSVEAARAAEADLRAADAALQRGDLEQARRHHDRARQLLPSIAPEQGRDQIAAAADRLDAVLRDGAR